MRLLVSAGHSVVALTRTPAKADAIRGAGAEAAIADAFNRAATVAAVASAKPDVIVHGMTALGAANDLHRVDQSFAVTNRLRTEGVNNLLAAARHDSHHMRHGAKALLRFSRNAHDADRQ